LDPESKISYFAPLYHLSYLLKVNESCSKFLTQEHNKQICWRDLHIVPSMLNVKQESSEYQYSQSL